MTVAVGAFADPMFPPAAAAYWTEARHGWLPLPEGLPTYAQNS
jgi:hypothetical protein